MSNLKSPSDTYFFNIFNIFRSDQVFINSSKSSRSITSVVGTGVIKEQYLNHNVDRNCQSDDLLFAYKLCNG